MFRLDDALLAEGKGLLQELLRIDTTNPPGNESRAVSHLQGLLEADGIATKVLEPEPGRGNLIARLAGNSQEEPLLLSCHLDVVPARAEQWTHPPFAGIESEGMIWGRGAIDMKGFAAMALTVFRLLHRRGIPLRRDLIFAAVADEETGCRLGSTFLVNEHPDLVRAEYAINEVGGFNVDIQGKRFYLIQRAERGVAWLRVKLRGRPGHSSLPPDDSCVVRAGKLLSALGNARFPLHPNEPAIDFLRKVGREQSWIERFVMRGLERPVIGSWLLHNLVPAGTKRRSMQASLCNTVTPTVVRAGEKVNVLPSEVVLELDGRVVPGSSTEELIRELRSIIGPDPEIEVLAEHAPVEVSTETPLYRAMEEVLRERDPEGIPAPYLVSGFTDSWNWARLGTQCYGFYPVQLPSDLQFADLFHGIDERIPVDGFRFGIECLYDLLERVAFS